MLDPHLERPPFDLPGCDWTSVDDARRWLAEKRDHLGWNARQFERAYYNIQHCRYSLGGNVPYAPVLNKTKFDKFLSRGRMCIPQWLYWVPLAIRRVQEVGWDTSGGMSDYIYEVWDRENVPDFTPETDYDEERWTSISGELSSYEERSLLLEGYRTCDRPTQKLLVALARAPDFMEWLLEALTKAEEKGIDFRPIVDAALAE